jgi:hypothetical protein
VACGELNAVSFGVLAASVAGNTDGACDCDFDVNLLVSWWVCGAPSVSRRPRLFVCSLQWSFHFKDFHIHII